MGVAAAVLALLVPACSSTASDDAGDQSASSTQARAQISISTREPAPDLGALVTVEDFDRASDIIGTVYTPCAAEPLSDVASCLAAQRTGTPLLAQLTAAAEGKGWTNIIRTAHEIEDAAAFLTTSCGDLDIIEHMRKCSEQTVTLKFAGDTLGGAAYQDQREHP